MDSLLGHFADAVQAFPDRIAIVDGKGRQTSFAALEGRAHKLAAHWQGRGVQPGDRVLMAMPVTADLYASLAALWSLGATVILPEPAMGLAGLRHAARTAKATAFCAAGMFRALQYALPELWRCTRLRQKDGDAGGFDAHMPEADDIALISFTSGTTGKPKAIPRSHGFLMAQFRAIDPLLASDRPERDLVAFPVFTLINIASGRTSVLPNWKMSRLASLAPGPLQNWLKKQDVTRALVPPALCRVLADCARPEAFHTVFTGGGPVFPDLVDDLLAKGPMRIVCVYGSTEAEPIAHLDIGDVSEADRADMLQGKGLLVGHHGAETMVRIEADEILVAGAHVNKGYLDPAHDAENKQRCGDVIWHRTGDAGLLDENGRLWLLGRVGSSVRSDTGVLYPFCVEVAARQWPGVAQVALMPDGSGALLVVEGDGRYMADWRKRAQGFGIKGVQHVKKIPMDRRHASKIDRKALANRINQGR